MPRIALVGAPYQGQSKIASAQRCVNLYAESNAGDPQSPVPITYYLTPGTRLHAQVPLIDKPVRCTYRTSKGTAYVVIGEKVYFLASNKALIEIGTITDRPSQVYMADNGLAVVIVDGSNGGWVIDIESNAFAPIVDPSFYGADFVVFLDTFFVFNRPETNQFYISLSMVNFALLSGTGIGDFTIVDGGTGYTDGDYQFVPVTGGSGTGATAEITVAGGVVTFASPDSPGSGYTLGDALSVDDAELGGTGSGLILTDNAFALAFDPLDLAAKAGSADPIVGIVALHRELWLIGELTTEVWIGTGAPDFYFQQVQGAYIDHGCAAQYSIANLDVSAFLIMQDKQGNAIIVAASEYKFTEISTPAIVKQLKSYVSISDAIGFCFQIRDHAFYGLVFPEANKSWLFEIGSGIWTEWAWSDLNGNLNRTRANCSMFVYGANIVGDWATGILWELNQDVFTDGNPDDPITPNPIQRIRTFPHILEDSNKVIYNEFDIDIECNTMEPSDPENPPMLSLRWSDNRGVSFGNPILASMGYGGATGYGTWVSFNRLGMARDRIFEVSWSGPMVTALNGAFIRYTPCFS